MKSILDLGAEGVSNEDDFNSSTLLNALFFKILSCLPNSFFSLIGTNLKLLNNFLSEEKSSGIYASKGNINYTIFKTKFFYIF